MLSHRICSGSSGIGRPGERRAEQHQYFCDVAGEQIEDELPDVIEDDAPFFDRSRNRVEAVVLQDDGRGLFRDVRAANTHRHADVRFPQRGRVVHAVTQHGDDIAPGLERLPRVAACAPA